MKTSIARLSVALLALSTSVPAQEAANPFIRKPEAAKSEPPPGPSFASLLEHILVPHDLLDDWLREHPMKENATELRAAVQGWVAEGKAKLDHTALTQGSAGSETSNDSIVEKIYPTEWSPGGAGAWQWPTAFDTRNLGFTLGSGIATVDETQSLWVNTELVQMVSSDSYDPLIEKTRQPDDVFFPRFRSMRINQHDAGEPEDNPDPFASSTPSHPSDFTKPQGVVFKPGTIHLAGRFDPLPGTLPDVNFTRLIFYRGEIGAPPKKSAGPAFEASRVSVRMVRVSLPTFSNWLLDRTPLAAANEASTAVEGWRKEGKAVYVNEVSSTIRRSVRTVMENIEEYIYPTEWVPGTDTEVVEQWQEAKEKDSKEGVATMTRSKIKPLPGLEGAGGATAFDTRNLGVTAEASVSNDDQGPYVRCKWERVWHLGESIHHRIKVDDAWIPDVRMPLFSSNHLTATVRVQPSQWTLLGSAPEYLENEKVDREHCLLVLVKVE